MKLNWHDLQEIIFAYVTAQLNPSNMSPFPPASDYWILAAVFSFVMGITWGSFFNVCIYRMPVRKSIVRPGSHCYHCGTFLKWYDNIPLVSYLILRGLCRSCGTRFSCRYFFVELLSGILFLEVFLRFGIQWALPFHLIFVSLLIIGVFTDIDHFILPDSITIGGTVFALAVAAILSRSALVAEDFLLVRDAFYSFVAPNRLGDGHLPSRVVVFAWSVLCAAFGYGLLAGVALLGKLLFQKEGMGGGDVKLFAFLGAYLGALNCIWILFLSSVLGATLGLSLLLTHKLLRKDEYEEIALVGGSTAILPWRTATFRSRAEKQLDVGASYLESGPGSAATLADNAAASPGVTSASSEPEIRLQIARRTSRQMHHLPYGPYIAVAAVVVLLCHDWLDQHVREFLMLPLLRK